MNTMKHLESILAIALLFILISCKKEENSLVLADNVIGNYSGTTTFGNSSLPCTTIITKTSDSKVTMSVNFNGANFLFGEIVVSKSGDVYLLYYSDQSGSISGRVEGNYLTYLINSGVLSTLFNGTKSN